MSQPLTGFWSSQFHGHQSIEIDTAIRISGMTMPDIPLVTWPSHMNVGPPFMIAKLVQITSITIVYDTYNYS